MGTRKDARYPSAGKVYIAEVPNTEALLKNLSASGLSLESGEFLDIVPKAQYSVDIVPEEDSNLDKFTLNLESRWIKTNQKRSESGFVIVIPPGADASILQKYLAYLAEHSAPLDDPV
jgi:hypothetical protein